MAEPLRVNIPNPRRVEELRDDEIDYLVGEYDKTGTQVQQFSDAELDEMLLPYARSGAVAPEITVTAPRINPAAPDLTAGEMAAGGARELAGGALFEFADEAEAAARAPFSDKSYDDIVREIRQSRARFSQAEPGAALALNMAGGIGSAFIPGVNVLGRAAQGLTGISKLASPVSRIAATGSLAGAVSGIGSGETVEERALYGLAGAGLGGVLGAGAVGIGKGARFARDTYRARGGGDEARAIDTAADIVADRIEATGSPTGIRARLDMERRYGIKAPLATSSPELSSLTETVMREPSASRADLASRLAEQQGGAPRRAQTQVGAAFPGTPDYFAAEESVVNTLRRNASDRYDAAYAAAPEIRDPLLRKALSNPAIQSAYQDAMRMSRDEMAAAALRGEDPTKYAMKEFMEPVLNAEGALVGLAPSGTMVPDLRSLDTVKRALDARVSSLYASGQGAEATALKQLRNAFVERLDKVGPVEYKAARAQYKGDIEIKEALEQGRSSNKLRWQEVAKLARDYSPGELDAFKTGFVQNIMRRFEDTSRSRNFADEIINTPNLRKSLQAVTGPGEFAVLEAALRREAELFKETSRVIGGSQTSGRLAEKQAIQERIVQGDVPAVVDLMLNPSPGNIFRRTMMAVGDMRNANVSRATFDQLAKMLSASSPRELDEVFSALETAAPARAMRAAKFESGAARAGVGAAKTIAPSPEIEKTEFEEPSELVIPQIGMAPPVGAPPQRFKEGGGVNALRSFGQGLSFGTSDAAEAFLRSIVEGGTTSEVQSRIEGEREAWARANPGSDLAAQMAGAVVPGLVSALVPGGQAGTFATVARIARIMDEPVGQAMARLAPKTLANLAARAGDGRLAAAGRGAGRLAISLGDESLTGAAMAAGQAGTVEDIPNAVSKDLLLNTGLSLGVRGGTEGVSLAVRRRRKK